MPQSPDITDFKFVQHTPPPEEDIEVSATIGNGQLGGWAVFLEGAFVRGGNEPVVVALGKGAALGGQILEVKANIIDVQGQTDRLSLRVRITGRDEPIDIEHIGPPGGAAIYRVLVQFGA